MVYPASGYFRFVNVRPGPGREGRRLKYYLWSHRRPGESAGGRVAAASAAVATTAVAAIHRIVRAPIKQGEIILTSFADEKFIYLLVSPWHPSSLPQPPQPFFLSPFRKTTGGLLTDTRAPGRIISLFFFCTTTKTSLRARPAFSPPVLPLGHFY